MNNSTDIGQRSWRHGIEENLDALLQLNPTSVKLIGPPKATTPYNAPTEGIGQRSWSKAIAEQVDALLKLNGVQEGSIETRLRENDTRLEHIQRENAFLRDLKQRAQRHKKQALEEAVQKTVDALRRWLLNGPEEEINYGLVFGRSEPEEDFLPPKDEFTPYTEWKPDNDE